MDNALQWLPKWLRPYLEPEMITSWAIMAGKALAILFIGWMVARWLQRMATRGLQNARVDVALARFLGNIVRYTVIFATVIAAAGAIGIETTSLTAIFASAGLAVGLALQGSLSNFAAGVMILFFRPFTIGDIVSMGGKTGKVIEIGLFASEMMLPDGTKVIVPNGGITSSTIENHTILGKRRATIDIGVDYGSDLAQVREVLTSAVHGVEGVFSEGDDPGYAVAFVAFGGSSLDWKVHVYAKPEDWLALQERVKVNIYNKLNEAGIGIPFPQLDVHFDQPPQG